MNVRPQVKFAAARVSFGDLAWVTEIRVMLDASETAERAGCQDKCVGLGLLGRIWTEHDKTLPGPS